MRANLKLILIGDVVAKLGRRALATVLPEWKHTYHPDAIIANVENLTHGRGITARSLGELSAAGVTAFTGGNHVWAKDNPGDSAIASQFTLALPANDPRTTTPMRFQMLSLGGKKLFMLNLLGQVFMHEEGTENPFQTFDRLFEEMQRPAFLIVDVHGEATSEKVALGYYLDGRASVVYGTHTHIPTADTRILAGGTGYCTDLGMSGSNDSVLGVAKEVILNRFTGAAKEPFEYPESGPAWVNALYCELDSETGRCMTIKQLSTTLTIN